ncbi:TRM11 family SAM-dependent methyltransferase [Paenibacillus abyssi]|uniref:Methyltransferase n=1 Tax=Paenibacillus abyssi TaxID=1340531 RepID=A0A917CQJ9_9BACL|nr:RsmD family RNA methyltransferase [Paenibacillus abyssi]GGF95412.1 methyltransferase [Paenibacillus abyssi]
MAPLSGKVQRNHYLYTYICHEDEEDLCKLELRTLFGDIIWRNDRCFESSRRIEPDRSPFIKQRLLVTKEAASLDEMDVLMDGFQPLQGTFKVVCLKTNREVTYGEQRSIERRIGAKIRGIADMRHPDQLFGVASVEGRWLFGELMQIETGWQRHHDKPQRYSTALSDKVARTVANIAVPQPEGIKAVDPCCGIGTVLLEALSMNINIIGYDINPLAVRGARANLTYYGYPDVVRVADLGELNGDFDVVIVDFPYNVCSIITNDELIRMLQQARKIAQRAVFVTVEPIDRFIQSSGWMIQDRCIVHKSSFARQIIVCE